MGNRELDWNCPICNYIGKVDEITTDMGEKFINCVRCGSFSQVMIKSAVKDLEQLRKTYPNNTETDTHITVRSGGFGTWKIIQEKVTHEGSFTNLEHIDDFLSQIDEMFDVNDVVQINYSIKENGNWIQKMICKN